MEKDQILRSPDGKPYIVDAPERPPFYKRWWFAIRNFWYVVTGIYLVEKFISHAPEQNTIYFLKISNDGISWTTDPRQAAHFKIVLGYLLMRNLKNQRHLTNINYFLVTYQDAYFIHDVTNRKQ